MEMKKLNHTWTGDFNYSNGGGGRYTSSAPIYLGLMAIAGAIFIKR